MGIWPDRATKTLNEAAFTSPTTFGISDRITASITGFAAGGAPDISTRDTVHYCITLFG
jgi:hypothetical protein